MAKQLRKFDTFFDMVYFINLPHRKDRLRNIKKLFEVLSVTRYKQIIPCEAEKLEIIEGLSRSSQSCKLAHMACLEDAIENGYERIMIFEDDACLNLFDKDITVNTDYHLSKCFDFMAQNDWGIFFFDNTKRINKRGDVTYWIDKLDEKSTDGGGVVRIGNKQYAHSYAVNGQAIQNLLTLHKSNNRRNDHNLGGFSGFKFMYDKGIFDQLLNEKTDNNWSPMDIFKK